MADLLDNSVLKPGGSIDVAEYECRLKRMMELCLLRVTRSGIMTR